MCIRDSIRGDGDVLTTRNHYAEKYYDKNNTSYYIDPTATSTPSAALSGRILSYDENSGVGVFSLRSLNKRWYGMNSHTQGMSVFTTENNSSYPGYGTRGVTALSLGNTPFGTTSASSGKDIFNITRVNIAAYTPSTGQGTFGKVLNLRGNGDLYLGHANTNGSVYAIKYYDKANTAYYLDPASTSTSLNVAGDITLAANLHSTGQNLKFHAAGTHVMNIDVNGKVIQILITHTI